MGRRSDGRPGSVTGKKFIRMALLVVALGLAAACTRITFAAVNLPASAFDGEIFADVSFGPAPENRLDIILPPGVKDGDMLPVIVFFHGGRWTDGRKELYR